MGIPSIKQEQYRSGQLLTADDFNTEQKFHIQNREFQTRQLFSSGILDGLKISTDGMVVKIAQGAAVDDGGAQILLGKNAIFQPKPKPPAKTKAKGKAKTKPVSVPKIPDPIVLTPQNGSFDIDLGGMAYRNNSWQLTIKQHMESVPGHEHQKENAPLFELLTIGASSKGRFVLATLTVSSNKITFEEKKKKIRILPSRVLLPEVEHLDAKSITTGEFDAKRIPALKKLSGSLSPKQLPDINKLNGLLDIKQLPASLPKQGSNLKCFVDQPVIQSNSTVKLTWQVENEVDDLLLSYLTPSGIQNFSFSEGNIPLNKKNYKIKLSDTTVFTITAKKANVIVAQQQLTVVTPPAADSADDSIANFAKTLYTKNIAIDAAIADISAKFKLQTFSEKNAKLLIKPIVDAGYAAIESVSQVANAYEQSENWPLMVTLARLVGAPTPTEISKYIGKMPAPVTNYLGNFNYNFKVYTEQILKGIVTPVGESYFAGERSAYAIYCLTNGVFKGKQGHSKDHTWPKVVSHAITEYFVVVKKAKQSQLPPNFSNIKGAATATPSGK